MGADFRHNLGVMLQLATEIGERSRDTQTPEESGKDNNTGRDMNKKPANAPK